MSGCEDMAHALLATEVGTNRDLDTFARVFDRIKALAQVRFVVVVVVGGGGGGDGGRVLGECCLHVDNGAACQLYSSCSRLLSQYASHPFCAQEMRSVRAVGSCALNLCGVACGRVDAFFEIGFGGCWDVAAGALILQEAGGSVLDPAGGPFDVMSRRVLGCTPALAPRIAAILKEVGHSDQEPGPAAGAH